MLSPRGTSVTPQLQHWMCTVLAVRALRVATVRQMYIRLSLGRQDTVWRGPESAPWMQLSNCGAPRGRARPPTRSIYPPHSNCTPLHPTRDP